MPGDDSPVVVDTTPLIALSLVGRLDLLKVLYDRVILPPAVRMEIEAGGELPSARPDLAAAPWIEVVPLGDPGHADLLIDLDRGEAEVIALARERRARLVILDERLGRRHARRLGLSVTGTLGVLLRAKELKAVATIRPIVETLRHEGIYLGKSVVDEVLSLAGE